jgi:sulfide dehydrogenase cytochrome subunit
MKINSFKVHPFFVLVLFLIVLSSCSDDFEKSDAREISALNGGTVQQSVAVTSDLAGKNLASNCFQCHGTNGYAGELKIAGKSASEFVEEMNEMKAKDPRANIMNAHARAYTSEEIQLIGEYFSKQ